MIRCERFCFVSYSVRQYPRIQNSLCRLSRRFRLILWSAWFEYRLRHGLSWRCDVPHPRAGKYRDGSPIRHTSMPSKSLTIHLSYPILILVFDAVWYRFWCRLNISLPEVRACVYTFYVECVLNISASCNVQNGRHCRTGICLRK
jgi:hypothetical protein